MRITQGCFSFLPDLTDAQVEAQVRYCLANGWAVSFEHTAEPHPRNTYWEMYGHPMFDARDAAAVMEQLRACRATFPREYIRLSAFDSTRGWETVRLSFLVNRPPEEAGFRLVRTEGPGRLQRYGLEHRASGRD